MEDFLPSSLGAEPRHTSFCLSGGEGAGQRKTRAFPATAQLESLIGVPVGSGAGVGCSLTTQSSEGGGGGPGPTLLTLPWAGNARGPHGGPRQSGLRGAVTGRTWERSAGSRLCSPGEGVSHSHAAVDAQSNRRRGSQAGPFGHVRGHRFGHVCRHQFSHVRCHRFGYLC